MNLRIKTLIIIVIYLAIILGSFIIYSSNTLEKSFVTIESDEVKGDLFRVEFAIADDLSNLDSSLADWAIWDDTYYFILGNNPDYVAYNLFADTYENLDLDVVLIYDSSEELIYAEAYNPDTGVTEPAPQALIERLNREFNRFRFDSPDSNATVSGFYSFNDQPLLLAARPVLTSIGEGPVAGTMFMGRYFDEEHSSHISESTGVDVTLFGPDDIENNQYLSSLMDTFGKRDPYMLRAENQSQINGYVPVTEIGADKSSYVLEISEPRIIYQSGIATINSFLFILLLTGLFFGLLGLFIIDRTILSRINRIISGITEVEKKGGSARILPLSGNDELSHLGMAINLMLDNLSTIQSRYRNIVEDQTEFICRFNKDDQITLMNPAFKRRFAPVLEENERLSLSEIPLDDVPWDRVKVLLKGLSVEKPIATGKHKFTFKSKDFWIDWTIRAIFDQEGNIVEYQFVGRDITAEQNALEENQTYRDHLEEMVRQRTNSLIDAQQELQKAERMESVGLLAGGIAHDFNNLLLTILGNIELLELEIGKESPLNNRIAELEQEVLRARSLTQQLLTFSRGGAPIRKIANITNVVRETAEFVCRGSNVRCRFESDADVMSVSADTNQISQVITNLVLNAIQAMPGGGNVEVSVRNITLSEGDRPPLPAGSYVAIAVTDHGQGIPPELAARIFEPFFTTKTKGGGLGLATSFSIIRKHGGHVFMASEEGQGATFTVFLPASSEQTAASVQEPPDTDALIPDDAVKARILVMDDEEGIRSLLSEMLTMKGYDVVTAKDGEEAITRCQEALERGLRFDIAIIDLTVPGRMGGKKAIRKLLEIDPDLKAIVSSGYYNDPVMADFKKYGFKGVMQKPFLFRELHQMIMRIIHEG
jgi:PAS domain S-box-containing protein